MCEAAANALFWCPLHGVATPLGTARPGMSIAAILDTIELPPAFATHGEVLIDGHLIERANWTRITPKPGRAITLALSAQGGQGGSRAILGLVVAFAAALASGFIASGHLFSSLGGAFAKGAIGANAAAGAVTLAGSLAARAISAPPQEPTEAATPENRGPASISGNVLAPGGHIPRVLGTRRLFPPLACPPIVERIGEDEFAEAVFVLEGPHRLTNPQIGGAALSTANDGDVLIEMREGLADDPPLALVNRYGSVSASNAELPAHTVAGDNGAILKDQVAPDRSVPTWRSVSTSGSPDEIWLHLSMPQGLSNTALPTQLLRVPIRIRIRPKGATTWINLPELHYAAREARPLRPSLRIKLADAIPETSTGVAIEGGWVAAHVAVPPATAPSLGWVAHPSFFRTGGSGPMIRGNEAASAVQRVTFNGPEMIIHMDGSALSKGPCDIEVMRGAAFVSSSFSDGAYAYSGTVRDPFVYHTASDGRATILFSRAGLADLVFLDRAVAVTRRHPVAGGTDGSGLAIMALRAKNRAVDNFSIQASGLVRRWSGTAFSELGESSNPADLLVHVLTGGLGARELPSELLDIDGLVAWRSACAAADWRCDHVAEGELLFDLMQVIAGCGYARPALSETWGVVRERDRTAEAPIQMFTPRNSAELTMAKAFDLVPDAIRATWREDGSDGQPVEREKLVYRPGRESAAKPLIEEIRYAGLTRESDVDRRALFDLEQAVARATTWSFKAPAEALRCRRGDLILINHDVIERSAATARIIAIKRNSALVSGVTLDSDVPVMAEPPVQSIPDLVGHPDLTTAGETSAVEIRRADGLVTTHPIAASVTQSRANLSFAAAVPADVDSDGMPAIRPGCLVAIGPAGRVRRRLVVTGIEFDQDLVATIAAVDEAPLLAQLLTT